MCFTTNKGYLFPTVVSAIQARANSSADSSDIAVYCIERESPGMEDFAEVCASEGIQFSCIDPEITNNSHVAFSRLFLDRFVPKQYGQLLYVDGDTQIHASLDPLIAAEVPAGHFMAATDPVAFKYNNIAESPKELRDYFKRLGLSSIKQYFNSGVLRINRDGWAEVAARAYDFCIKADKNVLNFWDQDGLNAVAAASDVRLPMSIRYNFPIFLRNCRIEDSVQPAIYHFMSAPKPWNGNFPPWNQALTVPYQQITQRYPKLLRYQSPFSPWKRARYILQQRAKQVDEAINWGLSWRRGEVLRYEDQCREFALQRVR